MCKVDPGSETETTVAVWSPDLVGLRPNTKRLESSWRVATQGAARPRHTLFCHVTSAKQRRLSLRRARRRVPGPAAGSRRWRWWCWQWCCCRSAFSGNSENLRKIKRCYYHSFQSLKWTVIWITPKANDISCKITVAKSCVSFDSFNMK